jgi:hypothetical protein
MLHMKKIFTTLSLSTLLVFGANAQNENNAATVRKCGTPILNEKYEAWVEQAIQKQQQFAGVKRTTTIYTIPVVFHIIHSGQAVGNSYNISQAQVNSQITILNQDFRKTNTDFATTVTQPAFLNVAADCEINFCAAKISPTGSIMAEPGIDRILASSKGWTNPPHADTYIDATIKPNSSWDPTKYLNIWIVYMNDGTLGYAQFPTVPNGTNPITDIVGWGGAANTDGVVFDYRYVGNVGSATYPYNKGRTATHEIGHWLGLRHITGDSNCGNDYCGDTPAQSSLTGGCPSTTGAVSAAGCGTTSPSPPGKMYQNYMDYSDDRCMTMFTVNQKARMQACMANCVRRTSLATSTVCSVTGIDENVTEMSIEVFPNPSSGDLFVTVNVLNPQDYAITVINTLGQTVKEIKQTQSSGGTVKIDLSDKSKGIYFVTIKSKSVSKTKRIVLQ